MRKYLDPKKIFHLSPACHSLYNTHIYSVGVRLIKMSKGRLFCNSLCPFPTFSFHTCNTLEIAAAPCEWLTRSLVPRRVPSRHPNKWIQVATWDARLGKTRIEYTTLYILITKANVSRVSFSSPLRFPETFRKIERSRVLPSRSASPHPGTDVGRVTAGACHPPRVPDRHLSNGEGDEDAVHFNAESRGVSLETYYCPLMFLPRSRLTEVDPQLEESKIDTFFSFRCPILYF